MRLTQVAVAAALGLAIRGGPADAGVVIDVSEVGGNVVTAGSGAIDLTGLTFVQSQLLPAPGLMQPSKGGLVVGSAGQVMIDLYRGADGPTSFGPSAYTAANSGSGDGFGVTSGYGVPAIFLPPSYVSGTALSGSSTYVGETFASLGLTPGTYVYTWGSSGAEDDTLTVKIGTVPEPATWLMMGLGFAGLGFAGSRRSRKAVSVAAG